MLKGKNIKSVTKSYQIRIHREGRDSKLNRQDDPDSRDNLVIKGLIGHLSCDKRELVLAQVAEHAGAELFHTTTAAVRLRGSAAHRARLHTQPASAFSLRGINSQN